MPTRQRVVILTGSGISAESGVSTFRDPDGIWAKVDYRDVATPEGFARDPERVQAFYNWRRTMHASVSPNAAHVALARLEQGLAARGLGTLTVVTQNVDALHEGAGSDRVIHMHGEVFRAWCRACDTRSPWAEALSARTPCPACDRAGGMRPDVVWFGETPYQMDEIARLLKAATLFVSIGTSGSVYPAAMLVDAANAAGAVTVELNLEPSERATAFQHHRHGKATDVVPAFVEKLLASGDPKAW
jgi:NAD-dependent deacetylase